MMKSIHALHLIYVLPLTIAVVATSAQAENLSPNPAGSVTTSTASNNFNPAISLILDGRFTDYTTDLTLPGMQLGNEAGLPEKGFSLGESELVMSSNIDNRFYGAAILALEQTSGGTEVGLEEAYLETLNLGQGFTVKAGQFLSGIGYLNSQHLHAQDFVVLPLVYTGLLGGQLGDTGVQLRYLAPTAVFWESGIEATRGDTFPGGDNENHNAGYSAFSKVGGDFSASSSWQLGGFGYQSQFDNRVSELDTSELALQNARVRVYGLNWVYKWAPQGNPVQRNFKWQMEWLQRSELGQWLLTDAAAQNFASDYTGKQQGAYLQGIYQWQPRWRAGLRYDWLKPDNQFSNGVDSGINQADFLTTTALNADQTITQTTAMVDYSYTEFSRFRMQFSHFDDQVESDHRVMLQYVMSLGSHGAHAF